MSSTTVLRYKSTIPGMSHRIEQREPREILSKNLRYLIDLNDLSERGAERRTGVSQKNINKILNTNSSPTLDTVQKLAGAFGLQAWQLMMPDLPETYQKIHVNGDVRRRSRK